MSAALDPSRAEALAGLSVIQALFNAAQSGSLAAMQAAASVFPKDQVLTGVLASKRRSLLHVAALSGQTDIVRWLIDEKGFGVDSADEEGDTALTLASAAGQDPAVEALLVHGASLAAAPTALHRAAGSGHAGVARRLLRAGADARAPSAQGSPLFWAASGAHTECAEALLACGADPNDRSYRGTTPLFLAAASAAVRQRSNAQSSSSSSSAGDKGGGNGYQSTPLECIELLLESGADPSAAAPGGFTPLHVAAESGNVALIRLLAQAGADLNCREASGARPVETAAVWGQTEAVRELLLRGGEAPDAAAALREAQKRVQAATAAELAARAVAARGAQGSRREDPPAPAPERAAVPPPEQPDEALAAQFRGQAVEAFGKGDFRAAADLFSFALRHATDDPATWANRGAAHLKLGAPTAALQDARVARALDPAYVEAWYREGLAAQALELWEDAAQAFYEAFQLDPDQPQFAQRFHQAIKSGREAHAAAQKG